MKQKREFSKTLLIQESILIWMVTIVCLVLSAYCIFMNYLGSLAWLSTVVSVSWAAYGVSQAMYYTKSKAENTEGGIKYETVLEEIRQAKDVYSNASTTVGTTTTYDYDYNITYNTTSADNVDEYQI